jgi:hypothetical protein
MPRTKQTARKTKLPTVLQFYFFQKSKKVDESTWAVAGDTEEERMETLSQPMRDQIDEWYKNAATDDAAKSMCDCMSEAGFPTASLDDVVVEYGRENRSRKKRQPFFKWYPLSPSTHTMLDLREGLARDTIYLRCKSDVAVASSPPPDDTKRVLVTPTVEESGSQKKTRLAKDGSLDAAGENFEKWCANQTCIICGTNMIEAMHQCDQSRIKDSVWITQDSDDSLITCGQCVVHDDC